MGVSGDLPVGSLVCSRSGRDTGKYYLVLAVEQNAYLQLIDGDVRGVDHPKRKNRKHVKSTGEIAWEIAEKLTESRRPTNPEIRKVLAELKAKQGCKGGERGGLKHNG